MGRNSLPDDIKKKIVKGVLEGLDYKDVAKNVGVSHQTVTNVMYERLIISFNETKKKEALS